MGPMHERSWGSVGGGPVRRPVRPDGSLGRRSDQRGAGLRCCSAVVLLLFVLVALVLYCKPRGEGAQGCCGGKSWGLVGGAGRAQAG